MISNLKAADDSATPRETKNATRPASPAAGESFIPRRSQSARSAANDNFSHRQAANDNRARHGLFLIAAVPSRAASHGSDSKTYAYGTANAKTETYTYDLAGRLKTVTDAKGQVLTLVRNKDDSIASYAYTNAVIATPGASFTYDPWYPRRTGMTDQFGSTSWTYKAVGTNGALATDTEDGPFGNDTVAYGYDTLGRVSSRSVGGATAETFGFDTLGRMNSHVTQLGSFTYGYLGNSGQVSTRSIGGITTTWGYDTNANDRRLLTISTTGAVARNFTYASNAYQITGITDTPAATHPWLGQSWSFSYDGSDRLLTGNGTIAGNSSFSYDKLDNATSFAGATASYNGLNQITAWNSSTHTYDNNGNLTGDGTRTYTYDAADRLKTVTQGGTTTTFAYDGLGRRLKQTVGTTETRYLWCGAAICQQRSNTDTVQKRFFAEGEYVLTGTKKYLTLTDHLGSVRDLIDITGTPTLVGSFDYTPYGATARSWGTVTPGYTYAQLFAHPNTGLLLSATRAYDPAKGRWLNRDPIREAGGINLYGYVGASPTMLIDPMGLDPVRDTLGFVPVIGAGLDAYDAFKCGNIGLGALHTALALVDMTGIGALGKGLLVGGFKMAALPLLREVYAEGMSMAWGSIRKRMLRRDLLTPRVPTHHWFFHQADYWPDWLINHPANLMPDIGQFAHDLAHRGGVLDGLIYGTPGWAKLAGIGTLSNFIGGVVGGLTNHGGTGCGCK